MRVAGFFGEFDQAKVCSDRLPQVLLVKRRQSTRAGLCRRQTVDMYDADVRVAGKGRGFEGRARDKGFVVRDNHQSKRKRQTMLGLEV